MSDDSGTTILLVEDEAIIALATKRTLERFGYRVVTAPSGEKAVAAAEGTARIDLVLMDINLGVGLDGTEAAALILRQRDLPLVFLSSHTEPAVVDRTEGITSYGYIVKNSGDTVLIAGIRMAFKLFEARARIQAQSDEIEAAYEEMQVANEDLMQTVDDLNSANERLEESERRLSLSERKYRSLVDNSHDIIYTLSPEGVFTFVSPSWTRLLGHDVSEVVGSSFIPFVHTDDVPACVAWLRDVVEKGRRLEGVEYRVRHADGSWRWHTSSAVPMTDDAGAVIGYEGNASDVTDKKLALDSLRVAEERYREAQRLGSVGNWEYDLRTTGFWGSDEAKRIYGFDPEESDFSTEEVERCIPERARVHQALLDLIGEGKEYDLEFDIIPKGSDDRRTIWSVAELHRDENGRPAIVTGLIQDVTERRRTERALRESEAKYRTLFEVSPLGIVVSDEAGNIVDSNGIAERVLGLGPADQEGKRIDGEGWRIVRRDGSPMPPDEYASVRALSEERLVENVEMGIVKERGEVTWISVSAAPIPLEGLGVAIAFTDITERVGAEKRPRIDLSLP
ncbi:MAG: PAS domain S-box protein [Spirochaetes bacterium]|nr:PAS domain S-box protein [Spirochaetota bacterium]MBU1080021.1 PAS domain S-box protein [Spirochaetota bacterium]